MACPCHILLQGHRIWFCSSHSPGARSLASLSGLYWQSLGCRGKLHSPPPTPRKGKKGFSFLPCGVSSSSCCCGAEVAQRGAPLADSQESGSQTSRGTDLACRGLHVAQTRGPSHKRAHSHALSIFGWSLLLQVLCL